MLQPRHCLGQKYRLKHLPNLSFENGLSLKLCFFFFFFQKKNDGELWMIQLMAISDSSNVC